MLSLALTDAVLCLVATGLASRNTLAIGYRLAFALLAVSAFLGFLRFSDIYPLLTWHQLFSIMSASAALPLLAVCVVFPDSVVARRKQFAILFLGLTMLLGLLISGLGKLRIYDQLIGLFSMALMLWMLIKVGELRRAIGAALMLAGSILFVAKVTLHPLMLPGDLLHLGMALGLIILVPSALDLRVAGMGEQAS